MSHFDRSVSLTLKHSFFLGRGGLSYTGYADGARVRGLERGNRSCLFKRFGSSLGGRLAVLKLSIGIITRGRALSRGNRPGGITRSGSPSMVFIRCPSLCGDRTTCTVPAVGVRVDMLSVTRPCRVGLVSSLIKRICGRRSISSSVIRAVGAMDPTEAFLRGTFLLYRRCRGVRPEACHVSHRFCSLRGLSRASCTGVTLDSSGLCCSVIRREGGFCRINCISCSGRLPSAVAVIPERRLVSGCRTSCGSVYSGFVCKGSLRFTSLLGFLRALRREFQRIPPEKAMVWQSVEIVGRAGCTNEWKGDKDGRQTHWGGTCGPVGLTVSF